MASGPNTQGSSNFLIQVIHGGQTFKEASTKINAFVMKADGSTGRVFPSAVLKQISKSQTPAAKDGYANNGSWHSSSYSGENGKIIMLQVSTSYRGAPYSNGCMLLSLREDAPSIKVNVSLRPNHNAVYTNLGAFVGRADVLSLSEARECGIEFRKQFISNFFDEEELEEIFTVTTLSGGTDKPETMAVKTPDGSTKLVQVGKGLRRRIRIRR